MIHFDFIVNDIDAENIIGALDREITYNLVMGKESILANNEELISYYNKSADYYKNLKNIVSESTKKWNLETCKEY